MKAIVCTRYKSLDALQLQEVAKPTPRENEVLVKIRATTISAGDERIRSSDIPPLVWLPMRLMVGLTRPRKGILGSAVAGEIEAVGTAVQRFRPGDQVFGSTGMAFGAHAEYICLPEDAVLASKPANLSYAEAASVFFGGHSALHFLRKGQIQKGQKVLVYGASGAVGTSAVQLAKYFGAEVTGVCSTANVELVRSLGADRVIDYTQEDWSQHGRLYDSIFDTVGKSSFGDCVRSLTPNGCYLRAVHMELRPILQGLWTSLTSGKKVIGGVASEKTEDLVLLKELVERGTLRPVIDREYPLEQIAEAYRYVGKGRKRGNVVITVNQAA